MKIYWSLRQIPELSELSDKQIRIVYDACIADVLSLNRWFLYFVLPMVQVFSLWIGRCITNDSWVGPIIFSVFAEMVGLQIFFNRVYDRSRPKILRYLEEHRNELAGLDA